MAVSVNITSDIAVVTMDNPPVNAIGSATRSGLLQAARDLAANNDISRVILTGAGTIFAAGADAREFDAPPVEPHLPDVIAAIEASPLPWIAAINGAALGGGAELTLGCHYRIAAPKAQIGFPEVTLGVVPGAGGTQRLPRLIGTENAVQMVSTGKPVKAGEALAAGLIDTVEEDPLAAAMNLDLSILPSRPVLSGIAQAAANEAAIEQARATAAKRMAHQVAPQRAIDLVELAAKAGFDEGMKRERQTFLDLRLSDQAKALRYAFFSERAARAPAEIAEVKPLDVSSVVVVGGGNMGASIAYALDAAGYRAAIIETDDTAAERARHNVDRLIDGASKRGLMSVEEAEIRKQRLAITMGYENLPDAQLAIEAAFEDMDVKKSVFASLEAALPENAILATNTSYLDINEMAASLNNPERLVGMHFFSPAHIMRLLEIVRGDKSSQHALATAYAVGARLRKIPVLSGVCDGFIGNRILARYREVADHILMDGSNPWEVDEAMVAFGYPMGPYEAQDMSGLDIAFANRKRQAATRDPQRRYVPIADRMVNEGRLGRKTSVGWYRYPGGNGKVEDPLVEDLIREEAHFAKVERREFTAEEIRTRILAAMINEAFAILDEGIAQNPRDIDLVLIHGYGFPRWRGGPMFYAEQVGLATIARQISEFAKEDPVVWKISPLLEKLSASDGSVFA